MKATIRTRLSTAIHCVVATAVICAVSTSAQAQNLPTKTVRFSDLNISSPEGAKMLYGRIRLAALTVCGRYAGSDPIMGSAVHACIDKAIDKAVRDVNSPVLTSLRFGGTGNLRLASQ